MYAYPRLQRATAEDLPPELFDLLTDFFTIKTDVKVDSDVERYSIVDVDKGELGNIALTCKHWAEQCLPTLYNTIKVRSEKDLQELASLLNHPHSRLRKYLWCLYLEQRDPCAPWFHHAQPIIQPILDAEEVDYNLALNGPGFAGNTTRPIRSIHHTLPRQMPTSFSPFRLLHLTDVRFRCFSDLVRLVSELAVLKQVVLERITWDRPMPTSLSAIRQRAPLSFVSVSDSQEYWPFVMLFIRWHRRGANEDVDGVLMMYPHERGALESIMRCVLGKYDAATDCVTELRMSLIDHWALAPGTQPVNMLTGLIYAHQGPHQRSNTVMTHAKSTYITPYIQLFLQRHDVGIVGGASYTQIVRIEVNLRTAELPFDKAIDREWGEFDEAAASLPRLDKVVFGVHTADDLKRFVEKEDELFPRLKAAGKLARARWHEKSGRWFAKGRDPEKEPKAGQAALHNCAVTS